MAESSFKLTYSTMFNPPEELHTRYDQALTQVMSKLGKEHAMLINGKEHYSTEKFEDRSPADTDVILGVFQKGTSTDSQLALDAASRAFPMWSHTPWQERVRLVRKAAEIMDERTFEMGVVVSLEVGKNRMEALGDVAETADLLRYSCDRMEANDGFIHELGRDPLTGYISTNMSILRPYGVWLVISPFNFPAALTGGPAGAALVTGNTLVMKPATDTPWTARLIAECFRDAGIPDGVFNYVTGPGSTLGQSLIESPLVAGITFTGSYDVGMKIGHDFSTGKWVRPAILELGGKNPAIVSKSGNLDDAALGIVRSSFGLQGQKCSACSRVFVERSVHDTLVDKMVTLTQKLLIGNPTERSIYNGPVINKASYHDYQTFCEQLQIAGKVLTGGKVLTDGAYTRGYYCPDTIVTGVSAEHPLWQTEMFLPITMIAAVELSGRSHDPLEQCAIWVDRRFLWDARGSRMVLR